ncbi:multidrug transporter AcrB (plasmid) [Fulvitalea axinellae]|uniref:Multidrug transporter AcrB n=1 Tax=Fulvitalea axinellae TaxID=1182444 RepID=A0AAU9D1B4_9BACT|nr:multidrug transporter AcrB [Fulvitalea axinellae]
MRNFIGYFVKYPIVSNLLILSIIAFGYLSMGKVRSTLVPLVDSNMVIITVQYPGASPEEVEKGITQKIENELRGINGIEKFTSSSKENSARIVVELKMETDLNAALQEVKNAVDGINSFPAEMEPPVVEKRLFATKAVTYALNGDLPLTELKALAQKIEDDLRLEAGVTELDIRGFPKEEIQIALKEEDMRRFGITFQEISEAVRKNNIDLTGGALRGPDEELAIRTKQKGYFAKDLRDIIIRTNETGAKVRLADVARITDRWEESPNRLYVDGKPAVEIQVNFSPTEDLIVISENTRTYFDEFNKKNITAKATLIRDRSEQISVMQDVLLNSGVIGIALVLLFLSLFINPRLSFWVAFSIPLCFMGMFIVAYLADITLNKMSLFGLIIVIGILVDDGVVICESIYQEYEKGKSKYQAAIDGTLNVFPSVFSGVLTTMVAFSTFFFLGGKFGTMFFELGIVVVATLGFSLLEGVSTLPAHIANSKALATARKDKKLSIGEKFLTTIRERYFMAFLKKSTEYRALTLMFPLALGLLTYGAIQGDVIRIGDTNVDDNSEAVVTLKMPAGTPEVETLQWLNHIERQAIETGKYFDDLYPGEEPQTITFITKSISSADQGEIKVSLIGSNKRSFSSEDFANELRNSVGNIPTAEKLEYVQESKFGKPISTYLVGDDLDELKDAKLWLKDKLSELSDLKNVNDDDVEGMREVKITLKEQAHPLGINLDDVVSQVRQGFYGQEVQRLTRGRDEVKIMVRYDQKERSTLGQLENMRVRLNGGLEVPLRLVADLSFERNVTVINHLNGKRQINVEADLANTSVSMSAVKREINKKIIPEMLDRFPDITVGAGGRSERMKSTYESMETVVPMVMIVIIGIIILTFRSLSQTFLVISLIPTSMIGAAWGHWFHGYSIDMPSYLGMVALIGVLINDSIVLIDAFNKNIRKGTDFRNALTEAIRSRFRPILLTTLTTCAGLFPIIISSSPETQFVVPMGISLFYGLLFATILTLIVLPSMMLTANEAKRFFKWVWTGEKQSAESVEPATKDELVNLEA